ncbi:hypothetical protein SS50377_27189 [Spironucleus salmonicida]|uniref:Uncharacterized protein n=1 Tax=Spironucleus salmonicida TaxID=348837 RepID=V6LWG4_9EUKA|nr:hypothetical protein SS50377_27181 [Spironucleus salmonicida]KAH0570896.1 hypothetical protein SS50377_27189 [Spironucleus salmonicida]|eukprot:EST48972.1 Hypothetical protein SS50377_10821 [Spironucleus salmonicida]
MSARGQQELLKLPTYSLARDLAQLQNQNGLVPYTAQVTRVATMPLGGLGGSGSGGTVFEASQRAK